MQTLPPTDPHIRPDGATDECVAGVGKLTEALERVERARGRLYDFHQLIGGADEQIAEAADMLEAAGCDELARKLREDIVGLNVLPGRWTFQVLEEFEETYYQPIKVAEEGVRNELLAGKKHVYESEMKERNRTIGKPGHEARPSQGE